MNELVLADRAADWHRLKALVLDSVSSPITRRVYNLGLDEFIAWYGQEPRPGFTKATVSAWRVTLEARGLGSVSINVRITAVRKLAVEAAGNGLLAPELAAGIARIKGAKSKGVRVGNWLSLRQAQTLLNAPDVSTKKGLRDRATLAVLLGCGLRRSEVAALTVGHVQQRDNRWCIVDLVGKHGRVRTIPMPAWVKAAIDAWTSAAGLTEGHVLRPMNRGDQVVGERMTEKVVWQLLQPYATAAGVPGIAPHDLRRSCAKMCRAAGGELEQIQLLLGHASVQTTERYLGTKQDLVHAPNDGISGMRPGEILALRPRSVAGDEIRVDQRVYKRVLGTPKNGKARKAAMSPGTYELFQEWTALAVDPRPDGFVFPSEKITTPLSADNLWRRYMLPKLEKVGLGWATFQALRRTNASLGGKHGADRKVAADQRGHGIGVSLDVYTSSDLDQKREAAKKLEDAVLRKPQPERRSA